MEKVLPVDAWSDALTRVRRLADSFAGALRQRFSARLADVVLFGSAARGDWTEDSDIDILVLLDRVDPEDLEWIVRTAYAMGVLDSGLLIQPVVMPKEEFQRLTRQERQFALEVERIGVHL